MMEIIMTYQGSEFCNNLIGTMEKIPGFKNNVSAAYLPHTNCLTKRAIQTFKNTIQKPYVGIEGGALSC